MAAVALSGAGLLGRHRARAAFETQKGCLLALALQASNVEKGIVLGTQARVPMVLLHACVHVLEYARVKWTLVMVPMGRGPRGSPSRPRCS